jgi:trk system potassium uptake protein
VSTAYKQSKLTKILRSPDTLLLGTFAGAILLGAIILWLPWCAEPGKVSFVDALFTSTSAVCVTGLVVVDTGSDFTFFGHVIIMLLIQTGGLGVMTFAAMAFQVVGWRISLRSQALVSESFFRKDVAWDFENSLRAILVITFVSEALGAVLIFMTLQSRSSLGEDIFFSMFHAVSAFCNAGFSVYRDNLADSRVGKGMLCVVMALIIVGGLGYVVVRELWISAAASIRKRDGERPTGHTLHTRVVLLITATLIVGGAILLVVFGNPNQHASWIDTVIHAFFQSVTARTAGFNSVDIGRLPSASLFTLIILMFIGGSPASCAGGVKTTALAILLGRLRASLYGRREVRLLGRSLPHDLVDRVDFLLGLAVFWNLAGILLLLALETHLADKPLDLIFEQVSAFGTVGLSTGLTPKLSTAGKLWIIATMYVGRLGPLTIALWMFPKSQVGIKHPKGTVMVG